MPNFEHPPYRKLVPGILVAIAIILFCAGSTVWVLVLWAFGGKTLSYSVPDVVQKSGGSDVGF